MKIFNLKAFWWLFLLIPLLAVHPLLHLLIKQYCIQINPVQFHIVTLCILLCSLASVFSPQNSQ